MGPNGSAQLTPDLQVALNRAAQQEQRKMIEAMIHIELPMVLINSIYTELLGTTGMKAVFGEAPSMAGAPMKPRACVCLPWEIADKLADAIISSRSARHSGIMMPGDIEAN
jgi:hypothetical protein